MSGGTGGIHSQGGVQSQYARGENPSAPTFRAGKTRKGQTVRLLKAVRKLLTPHKLQLQKKKSLSDYTVKHATPKNTYNQQQRETEYSPGFIRQATQRIIAKGYSAEAAASILQSIIRQPGNSSVNELINRVPSKGTHQQKWHDWAVHTLKNKGYSQPHANNVATKGLKWAGQDMTKFQQYITGAPSSKALEAQQDFNWAMQVFTRKGYRPQDSDKSIRNAMSQHAGNRQNFIQWVQKAPVASTPRHIDSSSKLAYVNQTLLPAMISELQKKGYSEQDATGIVKGFIRDGGGPAALNVETAWQSALRMPSARERETPRQSAVVMSRSAALGILHLNERASPDEIKKAYRKLALRHHPDKHVLDTPAEQKYHKNEFEKILKAYERLS